MTFAERQADQLNHDAKALEETARTYELTAGKLRKRARWMRLQAAQIRKNHR